MDNFHNSMGLEAGSSGGKKIYAFSPLTLVKSHLFENSCIWPNSFCKCFIYKSFHSLTIILFFLLVASIWQILKAMISFSSGLSCFDIRKKPGWFDKPEKFKQSEKFSFILLEKIENFVTFKKFENFAKIEFEKFENSKRFEKSEKFGNIGKRSEKFEQLENLKFLVLNAKSKT